MVGGAIGGAVLGVEYGLNQSSGSVAGVIVGPLLGAWLAPAVRVDEPLLGRLSVRMAAVAVVAGVLLTLVLWGGVRGPADIVPIVGLALVGLAIFGIPMFGVTLLCAMLWIFVLRTAAYR